MTTPYWSADRTGQEGAVKGFMELLPFNYSKAGSGPFRVDTDGNVTANSVNATGIGALTPSGDTTGAADAAAIQAKIATGNVSVSLGPGTFYVNTPLLPKSGLHLSGISYKGTIIIGVGCSVIDAGTGQTDNVEIDHIELRASGFPVFTGMNCIRWFVHDCYMNQLDGTTSNIWNANPVTLGIECRFWRNREQVANGGPVFADAWFLTSASGATQVNQCSWADNVIFSNDASTAFWYHVQQTGAGVLNECCEWLNLVFEHPGGGMIWAESMLGALIDNCYSYDSATNTWSNAGFKITKNATGGTPQRTTIRASGRTDAGPVGGAFADILLDSNCLQTVIDNCGTNTGNAPYVIDQGSAPTLSIRNMQATFTLLNGPTVPARNLMQGDDAATNSVLNVRSTATAPAQPPLQVECHATAENALGIRVHADTANRFKSDSAGKLSWGPGNAGQDAVLERTGAAAMQFTGTNVTVGGTFASQAALLGSAPTAPAGTTSTTLVMAGLGTNATGTPWALTPGSSGKVLVVVNGLIAVATGVVSVTYGGRFGTGTAPVNGAAVSGTRFGAAGDFTVRPAATGVGVPFALAAILSLVKGTAYWFDIAFDTANASDAASLADVSISLVELQ